MFDGKKDSVDVQKFIKKWDRLPHNNFKTIIRTEFFDKPLDFIWYDIISEKDAEHRSLTRFTYMGDIVSGLNQFEKTISFCMKPKSDIPIRKQKRND